MIIFSCITLQPTPRPKVWLQSRAYALCFRASPTHQLIAMASCAEEPPKILGKYNSLLLDEFLHACINWLYMYNIVAV